MDVTMVDVTDHPDIDKGDDVLVFGHRDDQQLPIDELADRGDTINYEILCNVSPRVRRIFVRR
jgi:alanine racemase